MVYVQNTAGAKSEAMPDYATKFQANTASYISTLYVLNADTLQRLAALLEGRRTVVAAHDAFGYLADAYGLNFVTPIGIDTEAELSAQELVALITQIRGIGVAALFIENISGQALVQQIADETSLKIEGPANSYFAMFERNPGQLLAALESS